MSTRARADANERALLSACMRVTGTVHVRKRVWLCD